MPDITNSEISLPNNWEAVGVIGQGSFGIVYRAKRTIGQHTEQAAVKHISMPRTQAELKAICSELGTRDERTVNEYLNNSLQDMLGEYFQMKAFLGHPNIVACQDIQQIPKPNGLGYDVYIWMELLDSLSNRVMDGRMDRNETIRMGMDICRALSLLKANGIVHRDISPQNIFVNSRGDYKLGDFGSARGIKGTSTILTMKGKFSYAAPEVMKGEPASFNSDLYSLGLVMYRLMNRNRHPFIQEGDITSARGIEESNYRRLGGEALPIPVDADEELGRIILKACAFEPRNRWQTPEEMYNALAGLSEGTVIKPFPVEPPQSVAPAAPEPQPAPPKLSAKKKRWFIGAAAGIILLGAALAVFAAYNKKASPVQEVSAVPTIDSATTSTLKPTRTPTPTRMPNPTQEPPASTATPVPTEVPTDASKFTYEKNDLGGITIKDYSGSDAEVVIPYAIDGLTVTEIVVNNEVQSFQSDAVQRIVLPAGLQTIDGNPFCRCENLKTVEVTPGNAFFRSEDGVLMGADGTLICYPRGKEDTYYNVPSGTKLVGDHAFIDCENLQSIVLPEGVQSIGLEAFYSCDTLQSIVLPEGLERIDVGAFLDCRTLPSITLPSSLKTMIDCNFGQSPFGGCETLKTVKVASGNTSFYSMDDVLMATDGTLICYSAGKTDTSYYVPSGTKRILLNAFFNCNNLQSIVLPEGVQSISIFAFQGCKNLKSITLPGSLTTIYRVLVSLFDFYDNIVYNCPNLEAVNVAPENTSFYSKDGVLMGADGTLICYPAGKTITKYTVLSGIKTIGGLAFDHCKNLQNVYLQEGLEEIRAYAFNECSNLKNIDLPRSVQSIGNKAFDMTAVKSVTVSSGCHIDWGDVGNNTDGDKIQVNYR